MLPRPRSHGTAHGGTVLVICLCLGGVLVSSLKTKSLDGWQERNDTFGDRYLDLPLIAPGMQLCAAKNDCLVQTYIKTFIGRCEQLRHNTISEDQNDKHDSVTP